MRIAGYMLPSHFTCTRLFPLTSELLTIARVLSSSKYTKENLILELNILNSYVSVISVAVEVGMRGIDMKVLFIRIAGRQLHCNNAGL